VREARSETGCVIHIFVSKMRTANVFVFPGFASQFSANWYSFRVLLPMSVYFRYCDCDIKREEREDTVGTHFLKHTNRIWEVMVMVQ